MHEDTRQTLKMGEMRQSQREEILEFYKRQWKEAHKPVSESPPSAEPESKDIPLSVEDNTVTHHDLQLPLEDALDPMRESPLRDKSPDPEGVFRDIQPSQLSPDAKPPGEFEDIRPFNESDTEEGIGMAQPTAAPPGSEPPEGTPPASMPGSPKPKFTISAEEIDWSPLRPAYDVFKPISDQNPKIPPFQQVRNWLKRYAGWAFIGAATVMVGLGEYAVAEALLLFALVAFAIQIHEWSSHVKRRWVIRLVKGFWLIGVALMLIFFGAVFYKMMGSKPWSNLSPSNESRLVTQPAPTSSPVTRKVLSLMSGISFRGGDAQRLDVLMKMAGYAGPTDMVVLIVYNNEENPNQIFVGMRPDLNARNSRALYSGEYREFQEGADTSRVWVRSSKGGKIDIDYQAR